MENTSNPQQGQRPQAELIAELNDALRTNISNPQGHNRVVMTQGIAALIEDSPLRPFWFDQQALLRIVRTYNEFGPDNNPYGQRDFGGFNFKDTRCFWKIDYYDPNLEYGSEDHADPTRTARVLTIATMAEY